MHLKGTEAALNAGMEAVITTTTHQQHKFEAYKNSKHFAADFTGDFFDQLILD